MQSLLILGRQPALGLAELESLYGSDKLRLAGAKAVVVDVDPCLLAFDRLGGSVKFCKILTTLETTDWREIEKFLTQASPQQSLNMPDGKMTLGISEIGFGVNLKQLQRTGLEIKKSIRASGRSVRLVPNKSSELNAAQVIHNKLTATNGWELVMIRDRRQTIIAQTVKVQDIESYAERDQSRPMRDPKVGMLPPKLAQIIINLAVGKIPVKKLQSICDVPLEEHVPRPQMNQTILDPFCGTGVLLQEALLMGYDIIGSDIEERMVDYTKTNLAWLGDLYNLQLDELTLNVGDARSTQWPIKPDFIACEAYLGRPFSTLPDKKILQENIAACDQIIKNFLINIKPQISSGTKLCLAVPAWQTGRNKFIDLPLIDSLSNMGYNRQRFEHAKNEDLIYYRSDQIVGRRLIIITKS